MATSELIQGIQGSPQATPEIPVTAPVPQEKNKPQETADYGPNNENLPVELQRALWQLLTSLEEADQVARRTEIRGIFQRRRYFEGQYYDWYSDSRGLWMPYWVQPLATTEEDTINAASASGFRHATNIFQPYALSLMAVLTQNAVPARFWPQDVEDQKDMLTAKAATKVTDLVHRNNGMAEKADKTAFYLCTDGFLGAYVRYVNDGEKYGYEKIPIHEEQMQEIAPERYQCAECSKEYPTEQAPWGICPSCGSEMQLQPAEQAPVPVEIGRLKIPRGQEVIDIIPALHLRRSMWADNQSEFLYMDWIADLHKATVKATYPHVEEAKLDTAAGIVGEDAYEHTARRWLYEGYTQGMRSTDMGIFRRAWIRPRAFWALPVGTADRPGPREQLLELFPDGCRVAFYGDVYCEARNESMDAKWVTMNAMPGQGQVRETLLSALVPLVDQLVDLVNLIFEITMYGVPETFIDKNSLDAEARKRQVAQPGAETFLELRAGQSIDNAVKHSPATEPSAAAVQYRDAIIGEIGQFITGVFPALFGGDTGGNDTAAGISIQRDQALGRIGRVWRKLQQFWADVDVLGVKCFGTNRTEDVKVAVFGPNLDFGTEEIPLDEVQGSIVAYPEVDQQYPVLQAQIRTVIMSLLSSGDPHFAALLTDPENFANALRKIGITDIKIPGEDQSVKTHRDIQQLLKEQPQIGDVNPQTGQPQIIPSVIPDEVVDNLPIALATVKKWLISDAGQAAKNDNPIGFANVRAYAMACEQMQKAKELQMALAAGAVEGKGPAADLGGAQDVQQPKPAGQGAA